MHIYTITVISSIECKDNQLPELGITRTVGFYVNKTNAVAAVTANCCNINEYVYNYALIERIDEGLYSCSSKQDRMLFRFNDNTKQYEEIDAKCLNDIYAVSIG